VGKSCKGIAGAAALAGWILLALGGCASAGPAGVSASPQVVQAAPGSVAPRPPTLALGPCPAALAAQLGAELGAQARCATHEVFEDRAAHAGRRIALQVLVLPATGAERRPDPLFVLVGGPGQAATSTAPVFAKAFAALRAERDLVLVDQRGTGGSHPLHCALPGSDDDPQGYLGDLLPLPAVRDCLPRLDADPRFYTTPLAVDDLEEVRAALGYGAVDLFGHSYGSRAALVWMRRHPASVRSAILYGAAPTSMHPPLHHAPDAQRALDLLLAACAADAPCAAAYPDLAGQLREVLARLAAAPATAAVDDPKTGRRVELRISRDVFAEVLRWRLYDERAASVPAFIAAAQRGDFAPVGRAALALRRAAAAGALLAVGTFLSTTCAEDLPGLDRAEGARLAAGTFLGTYRVDQQLAACAVWPRGELPSGYAEPVRSEVPALVVSGERDPVTPPRWGEEVVRYLPHGRHLVLAHGAHGVPGPCVAQVLAEFVARGTAEGLDTSCVGQIVNPPFELPKAEGP
jgi:pimeloyl-ACP methyl ester carboxylesterase